MDIIIVAEEDGNFVLAARSGWTKITGWDKPFIGIGWGGTADGDGNGSFDFFVWRFFAPFSVGGSLGNNDLGYDHHLILSRLIRDNGFFLLLRWQ